MYVIKYSGESTGIGSDYSYYFPNYIFEMVKLIFVTANTEINENAIKCMQIVFSLVHEKIFKN